MTKNKQVKWQLNLKVARDLRKQGSGLLFDRVVALVECYDDGEFRQWCSDENTNAMEYLDGELDDTAYDFMTLREVLATYPERESWLRHNIRDMVAEVMASQKKVDQNTERISWKERALAAERECERLRSELATVKELVISAVANNTAARNESVSA